MISGTAFIYSVIAGLLPSLIWLFFWIREDKEHAEPRYLLVGTFFAGMLSVIAAVFAEKYIADIVADESLRYALWAAVEEIFKFAAVALVALKTASNDEPIDAMIYCIVVALGFAAVENALFAMGPLSDGSIAESIVRVNLRFIGATLVHMVSTGMIGFALGMVFYRGHIAKIAATLAGLAAAIVLHAGFNLSIINADGTDTLRTFAWVWATVIILIVMFEEVKAVRPKILKI
jgi:RsiW-degrading membrane proteinase PrsW (M82 family)